MPRTFPICCARCNTTYVGHEPSGANGCDAQVVSPEGVTGIWGEVGSSVADLTFLRMTDTFPLDQRPQQDSLVCDDCLRLLLEQGMLEIAPYPTPTGDDADDADDADDVYHIITCAGCAATFEGFAPDQAMGCAAQVETHSVNGVPQRGIAGYFGSAIADMAFLPFTPTATNTELPDGAQVCDGCLQRLLDVGDLEQER